MYLTKKILKLSIGKKYDFFRIFRVEVYSALALDGKGVTR